MKKTDYYRVVPNSQPIRQAQEGWASALIGQWNSRMRNGQHRRLQTTESPSISACTTQTNLSSLGDFQSNSSFNFARRMNKEDNLKRVIPEIEPLQKKKDEEAVCVPAAKVHAKPSPNMYWKQLIAAVAVSWVSLIIGYSTAYTAPAQSSLQSDFEITKNEMTWISSFMPLGAVIGGLFGGSLIEYLGRKWTILLTNFLFLTAWTIKYFAQGYMYLYIGRMITGLSVGIASLSLPVYLVETIQPEVRGSLGLLPTALGNIGILICYAFGTLYQWQELALIGVLLSLPFLILIWFIPETPRFLISKGKEAGAQQSLQWLRGANTDIEKEFQELQKNQQDSVEKNESVLVLFNLNNLKLLGIVLGLMVFQQFSGINAVVFYATDIFKASGTTLNEAICTTIVGVVNFVSTFIAAILIDRLGRKVLLYISSVSMIIALAVLGTFFYLKNVLNTELTSVGWVPLTSFVIYIIGFSLGFGPVPWLMMGEILPARIRGPAASVSTAFNWSCTFVVTKTFLLIPIQYMLWMYGSILVCGLVFAIFIVPETRGQSLADIERKLAGVEVRRVSSLANLKPTPSMC